MNNFLGYQCSLCGKTFDASYQGYVCDADAGNLDVILDYQRIRASVQPEDLFASREPSLWRYLPLLPVNDPGYQQTALHTAGWTPVYHAPSIAQQIGIRNLWIKDEGRNPTASFKDRASAILIARAKEIKAPIIATASTGNAGAALAGMAAAAGWQAIIFAPKSAPPAKIAQLLIFGAKVILVDGNYDQAFDLSVDASIKYGWYCRNTGYNAFTAEGKKTAAFEIWEQVFPKRVLPDRPFNLFVSVGDGNIISGIHKGFKDLLRLGWIEQMPRIFGVQSEKSAAVYRAWSNGTEKIQPVSASTFADSISVDLPRDGVRAVRAAFETKGAYIAVPDESIYAGISALGKLGIFAEPAGATAYIGMLQAAEQGLIGTQDEVLVVNTGSGLKDIRSAMEAAGEALVIEPNLKALEESAIFQNLKSMGACL
ncbi:threonine synthase [Flexilinea flocculi]|uniref:Threonine synthase n=1 Tax=Flexilinea flocculi TaxID=1678840 RepID=A0A0K8PCV8_9CHLR|nr:threonine synthase [Flexilinea flocculi]GAP39980.1 threonine synthase [Flexilinea flocculi]